LPKIFGGDFGDQIGRFVTLTDPTANKFDVLVERINGDFFLTKGYGKQFVTFMELVSKHGLL